MVLKPDQQRVCMMLKETITLLCKNGLTFKNKFCISAVIGVTLDDENMFHVSMNEVVKTGHDSDSFSSGDSDLGEGGSKQKRRRKVKSPRTRRHSPAGSDSYSEYGNEESESDNADAAHAAGQAAVKSEHQEDEKQDIIFVKQEIGVDWSRECGADMSQLQDANNLTSSSEMNVTPLDGQQSYDAWLPPDHQSANQYSASATMTTTGTNMVTMASQGEAYHSSMDPSLLQSSVYSSTLPYQCRFCGKRFSYPETVQRHEKATHLGVFPYQCQYCGKGFQNKDNMKGHLTKHTGSKAYRCSECGEEFRWRPTLDSHIKKVHKKVLSSSEHGAQQP